MADETKTEADPAAKLRDDLARAELAVEEKDVEIVKLKTDLYELRNAVSLKAEKALKAKDDEILRLKLELEAAKQPAAIAAALNTGVWDVTHNGDVARVEAPDAQAARQAGLDSWGILGTPHHVAVVPVIE